MSRVFLNRIFVIGAALSISTVAYAGNGPSNGAPQSCLQELFGAPVFNNDDKGCGANVLGFADQWDGAKVSKSVGGVFARIGKVVLNTVDLEYLNEGPDDIPPALPDDHKTTFKCGGRTKAEQNEFKTLQNEFQQLKLQKVVIMPSQKVGTYINSNATFYDDDDHKDDRSWTSPQRYQPASPSETQPVVQVKNGVLYITPQFTSAENDITGYHLTHASISGPGPSSCARLRGLDSYEQLLLWTDCGLVRKDDNIVRTPGAPSCVAAQITSAEQLAEAALHSETQSTVASVIQSPAAASLPAGSQVSDGSAPKVADSPASDVPVSISASASSAETLPQ